MTRLRWLGFSVFVLMLISTGIAATQVAEKPDKLLVLWTSGDKEVATHMLLMYTHASGRMKWWDDIRLVIWGPSSKLLAVDAELQEYVKKLQDAGVQIQACVVCANKYDVADDLKKLGIDVKPMGKPLTKMIKNGWHLLSV